MESYVKTYLDSLNERWSELTLLLDEAEKARDEGNDRLVDTLSRVSSILLVTHMESFLKEIIKAVVNDLNKNLKFNELPEGIRSTASDFYFPKDLKSIKHYSKQLSSDLMISEDFKINDLAFIYLDKNPKASIIQKSLKGFGVEDLFKNLHDSFFDCIFDSTSSANRLLNRMKTIVETTTNSYPYNVKKNKFKLKSSNYSGKTLWQEFIEDITRVRNNIVHGHTFATERSIEDIKKSIVKVRLLQYIITYIVSTACIT